MIFTEQNSFDADPCVHAIEREIAKENYLENIPSQSRNNFRHLKYDETKLKASKFLATFRQFNPLGKSGHQSDGSFTHRTIAAIIALQVLDAREMVQDMTCFLDIIVHSNVAWQEI